MRACLRCGYESADHLAYCVQCGRRRAAIAAAPRPTTSPGKTQPPAAFGDANALVRPVSLRSSSNAASQGLDSLRYVFTYLRSRMDADARRRRLLEEREGAARLVSGALSDLGQALLDEGINSPELTGFLEAVGRAQAQRETAMAEISSTEAFRAVEDARLAVMETGASAELLACEKGVEDAERTLRQIDEDRRKLPAAAATGFNAAERAATELRRVHLDQHYDTSRERAAALRAAGLAARAKLDQITTTRRQSSAALTASMTGHARERTEAELNIHDLKTQIGRIAWQLRLPEVRLIPRYERLDRHHQTITERDRQIATVEAMMGRYDKRKLGVGIGVLTALAIAATLLLRTLFG